MAKIHFVTHLIFIILPYFAMIHYCLGQVGGGDNKQESISGMSFTTEEITSTTEEPDIPCNTFTAQWVQRIMSLINICNSETGGYDANGAERMRIRKNPFIMDFTCILKCVAIQLGLLTEKGGVDEVEIAIVVDENTPLKFRDLAREVLGGCLEHTNNLNNSETDCRSYRKLFKCIVNGAPRVHKLCYPHLHKERMMYF